jgi:hypothetical protein
VLDAEQACLDLDSYRNYIGSSMAEWSVAKSGYVQGQPGWFSERSACYLAAGRPVVVQDTGLRGILPVGTGIVTFSSLEEAAEALGRVRGDYARHAQAARDIAGEYFDSDKVLTRLVDEAIHGVDRPQLDDRHTPTASSALTELAAALPVSRRGADA